MAEDQSKSTLGARIVHLDLKGAPMCIGYYEKIFPLLKHWGVTGLLVEYEDTFPYDEELKTLAAPHSYSKEDIKEFLKLANENSLSVIPLVQTFGHLEFVLKHAEFSHLREVAKYPMALCPSNQESVQVACRMLDQVLALHPNIQHFHIGCDEVYHLGVCDRCKKRMKEESLGKDQLFFAHVREVASHVRRAHPNITCLVWDDMFRFSELPVVLNCGLGELVEPMIWHYVPKFMLPPDIWDNLSSVFSNVWIASAFKGATGPRATITNIRYHLDNHNAWLDTLKLMKTKFKTIRGIAVTGWQRYDHYAVLCELFPHGLPSLALCLKFIQQGVLSPTDVDAVTGDLKFSSPIPINPFASPDTPVCEFPGSDVYTVMIDFVHTEAAVNDFFNLEGMASWMNSHYVSKNHINPIHIEPLLCRGQSLLTRLKAIEDKICLSFKDVFVDGVEEEWKNLFLTPLVTKMEGFVETAKNMVPQ